MKSAVETLNPTRVKLSVEVPYEELKPSIDAAYAAIGSQIQVPGFRKGKVPTRIIEQRVGRAAVLQEAVNESLPQFYAQAIDEQKLHPLGQPEVEVTSVPVEDESALNFTAELDVRPEFDLPDFSAVKIEVDPVVVSDEDVDADLQELRNRFATVAPVERAAAKGDQLSIGLRAVIGEEEIDSADGIAYEIGNGSMLEGLDEALTGLNAGESKTFTSKLAGGEHEGEDADVTVTLESIKERVLPELDDDFAQTASSHDTIADLRAEVAEGTAQRKRVEQGIQAREKLSDLLDEQVDVAVPDGIVDAEVNRHLEGEDRLEDDEHRAEVDTETRKALKSQFILDKVAEENDIQVGQNELIEFLIMSAQQYGMDPNQFAQILDQNGQVPAVMADIARRKALATLLEKVTVVDTNGETVDMTEDVAIDDGTDEEADEVVEVVEANDVVEADEDTKQA